MAAVVTFPNPYLVAILLVCSTRTGSNAQILFHYPPRPLEENLANSKASSVSDQADLDKNSDSDDSTTDEDDSFALPGNATRSNHQFDLSNVSSAEEEDDGASVATSSNQKNSRKPHSGSLFGFAEDGLVSLLSPDRAWHKRKFEMGINDLTFVGRPVFVRQDGSWRSNRRSKQKKFSHNPDASDTATDNEATSNTTEPVELQVVDSATSASGSDKSPLTMFNVVFVMNPPPLEQSLRIRDMYDHVIKKFSRALKWEQAHNDYVWKETELISNILAETNTKWSPRTALTAEILAKSSLATAISTVYTSISNSKIALVTLSSKVSFSLQIPPATSTSYLPSLTSPPIQPGLWLTTATDIGSTGTEAGSNDFGNNLHPARHFTLLLKSPPHRIAKDVIEAGGPLAAHLPEFVSNLRPTKSFHKLSVSSKMSLDDIQLLAHHLIYWRRAVAIPPLQQKDYYIVSPNADMRKLRDHSKSYEQQFVPTMPNMPSLPKILSILSGIPQPFGNLIPSKDHKDIYYLALAWLLRHGWVTQLRTFVYIRVRPDVKKWVRDQDREAKNRNPIHPKSQTDEQSTARDIGKVRKRPSINSRPSSDGKRSNEGGMYAHNPRMASLILNPQKAAPLESRWLDRIEDLFATDEDLPQELSPQERHELQKYWPLFVKYFNGNIALETIPVREGLKRKLFLDLLRKLGLSLEGTGGVEDQNQENTAILVPIRHW